MEKQQIKMIDNKDMANKVYKFIQKKNVYITTDLTGVELDNEWLKIEKTGKIKIKGVNKNGYAWDGCSPKFEVLDLLIGTPDGAVNLNTEKPYTYYASMFHDCLYQFKDSVPVSRFQADMIFTKLLKRDKFFWWAVYGFFVFTFGCIYGKWKTKNYKPVNKHCFDCFL